MKLSKILILVAVILTLDSLNAQPPAGKAEPGTIYGVKVDASNVIEASELLTKVKDGDTIPVKVRGKVLDVCRQKGCWLTMRINDSTEAFVKMKDYGFFVPLDLKEKTVLLDGIAYVKTTSVAELKHYAEDGGKSKSEIDAITRDEKQIRLLASGILVSE